MLAYFGEDLPSGAKLLGGSLLGAAIVAFLTGHRFRMLSPPMVLRVVLVLFSIASAAWSVTPEASWSFVPRILQMLVFIVIIWEFAVTYQGQLWVLRSFLFGMVVPLAMQIVGFRGAAVSRFAEEARYTGGGHDLNYLAYMYSVSVLIAVYLATNSLTVDRYCRWFYWGLVAACGFGTVLTGSRGGFVALVIAGIFAMVLAGVARRRIFAVLQVLALAAVVFVLVRYIVPATVTGRVSEATQNMWDDPRMRILQRGLAAIWNNPLFGSGNGSFMQVTLVRDDKLRASHNTYLGIVVELGFVGLTIYLVYLIMVFRATLRLPRREKLLWLGIFVVLFWNSFFGGGLFDRLTLFLHVMLLVQAAALARPSGNRPSQQAARRAIATVGPLPRLRFRKS